MGDYSKGGFWTACVFEGIAFFFARNQISGLARVLGIMVPGLIGYFIYLAYNKSENGEDSRWTSEEIFTGFLVAVIAAWVPVILGFIFGWGPNYYSGY